MLNSDLSLAAPQEGGEPPQKILCGVHAQAGPDKRSPAGHCYGRTFIESVVANSFVPSNFLVDGQVSGLGTVHPLLTFNFFSTWILPLHVVSCFQR